MLSPPSFGPTNMRPMDVESGLHERAGRAAGTVGAGGVKLPHCRISTLDSCSGSLVVTLFKLLLADRRWEAEVVDENGGGGDGDMKDCGLKNAVPAEYKD